MNEQIKQRWVSALRSGEYEQCEGALCQGGKYCCLGVLTDLYAKETGQEWQKGARSWDVFDGEGIFLPLSVQEWAGLENKEGPMLTDPWADEPVKEFAHIINDDGVSFETIADLIEQEA